MWTKEREDRLAILYAEGFSASQIAKQLGPDVTRNGVLGKVHRWKKDGIKGPWSSGAAKPKPRPYFTVHSTAKPRPKPSAAVDDPEPEPIRLENGAHVSTLALNSHMCRWPYGDPAYDDFHYCGHHKADICEPYCDFHKRKASEPRPEKRKGGAAVAVQEEAA